MWPIEKRSNEVEILTLPSSLVNGLFTLKPGQRKDDESGLTRTDFLVLCIFHTFS